MEEDKKTTAELFLKTDELDILDEDPEILDEVDAVEDLVDLFASDEPDFLLLELEEHKILQRLFEHNPIPFGILDTKLRLIWQNREHRQLLDLPANNSGNYYANIFNTFNDNDAQLHLYKSIHDPARSFSFRSKVEAGNRDRLTIKANLFINPIFDLDTKIIGYMATLDDVTAETRELLQNTFLSLLEASKLKDNDTGRHIERVNQYSKHMAMYLYNNNLYPEVDREYIENIGFLAAMHDVGKIGTPDDILNKEGPLDKFQWEIMQEHTINGAYILSTYPNPMAKEIALFHHEKWDGTGYPYQVEGEMIPLSARIVAISDVYDALRMKRSYKSAFSHQKTLDIILEGQGRHFDPDLIGYFKILHLDYDRIFSQLKDE